MPKEQEHLDERIPSYEESIATSRESIPTTSEKASPRLTIQQRNRLKRARLVKDLTTSQIEPLISQRLEDGVNSTVTILLPFDAFPSSSTVSESSITSPSLPSHSTLLRLSGDDYKSSFLHQPVVIQDLASTILTSLVDPLSLQPSAATPSASLPVSASLPSRPAPKNWFKRTFSVPGPEHDPTGSTGQWNLGWKSDTDPASASATVSTDEVEVRTRLQEVSFRMENAMGLLESESVKCVWCEVQLKT